MADNIKGITIQIGGDVQPLNQALAEASRSAANYSKQLADINNKLKLDPKNIDLLTQKQNILNEAIAVSDTRLDAFKSAYEEALNGRKKGTVSQEQIDALDNAIRVTAQDNQLLRDEADRTQASIDEIARSADDATGELDEMDDELDDTSEGLDDVGDSADVASERLKALNGDGVDLARGFAGLLTGTYKLKDAVLALNPTNILTLVTAFGTGAVKIAEYLDKLDPLIQKSKALNDEVDKSAKEWQTTQRASQKQADTYLVLFKKVSDLNDKIKIYKQLGYDTTDMSKQLEYWSGILNDTVGHSVTTYDKETGTLKETNKQLTEYYKNLRNNAILEAQAERLKQLYVEQWQEMQTIAEYQEKIDSGAVHIGTSYQYLQNESQKRLDRINEELGALEKANNELISSTEQISDTYYTEGKESGNNYYQGFKDSKAASKIHRDINDAIQTQISVGYANSKKFIARITGLAQGGIVTKPTLAMVGEGKGPEAVIPLDRLGDIIQGAIGSNRQSGGVYNLNVYPRDMSASQQDALLNKFNRMLGGMTPRESI